MKDVLAVVLAGGKGARLGPLTRDRAKPAVPFGGIYRIVDFTLSNCLNSGLRRILVTVERLIIKAEGLLMSEARVSTLPRSSPPASW